jgi:hypothetical protein
MARQAAGKLQKIPEERLTITGKSAKSTQDAAPQIEAVKAIVSHSKGYAAAHSPSEDQPYPQNKLQTTAFGPLYIEKPNQNQSKTASQEPEKFLMRLPWHPGLACFPINS